MEHKSYSNTMRILMWINLVLSVFSNSVFISAEEKFPDKPFVIGRLKDQLGNNLFQVATTCAHAWDHGAEAYFPDLSTKLTDGMPTNYAHVFFRCNANTPNSPVLFQWKLPKAFNFCYCPIPYKPNMELLGSTFQSEKFFAHYRSSLLKLFAPHPTDLKYINDNYGELLNHPCTVGIQIRWFGVKKDERWHKFLVQYGYDYFKKALSRFPKDAIFVISTNDREFAIQNLPKGDYQYVFLEGEPYYIDFYILSLCKHNIISNSTFGWWAAWLNQNPNKIVVVPKLWVDPKYHDKTPVKDVWPKNWIQINAKWGKPQDDINSFR